jgi:protein phosphatase
VPSKNVPEEETQLPGGPGGSAGSDAGNPPEAAPKNGNGSEPKPSGDDAHGADGPGSTHGGSIDDGARGPASKPSEPSTTTDPHLGEHLSAAVLREELSTRPHELVGAAVAAAESGSIPTIAGRTVARRAATVLTHKSDQDREETDEYKPAAKPRRWVTIATAVALLVILSVGLWLGYAWTQTRYYIGEYDQRVAIFNGVSQRLGPIQLSTLETVTDVRMSDLPEFSQQRVRQTVPARDLYDAQRIVKNLDLTGTTSPSDDCVSPSPASTAAPAAPGTAPAPTGTAAPPGTTTPSATPSPSANVCEEAK